MDADSHSIKYYFSVLSTSWIHFQILSRSPSPNLICSAFCRGINDSDQYDFFFQSPLYMMRLLFFEGISCMRGGIFMKQRVVEFLRKVLSENPYAEFIWRHKLYARFCIIIAILVLFPAVFFAEKAEWENVLIFLSIHAVYVCLCANEI